MTFVVPDLVVESVIRDGIANMIADPTILDDVFAGLALNYANRKYGAAEITRIKDYFTGGSKHNIAIVHSFHEASAKELAYSIQLGSDNEDKSYIDDFDEDLQETITDAGELAALIKVAAFTPTSYDTITGMVRVPDSVDLSTAYVNFIFVDSDSNEFVLQSGISNETGDKFFFIPSNQTVALGAGAYIRTFLNYTQTEVRSSHHRAQLLLGVHSKEPLLTKYMYTLLKYFLKSRKHDLINRGFLTSTMTGSDFTRDLKYEGDLVYTRFLTLTGLVKDSWRADQVTLIDSIEIDATPVE